MSFDLQKQRPASSVHILGLCRSSVHGGVTHYQSWSSSPPSLSASQTAVCFLSMYVSACVCVCPCIHPRLATWCVRASSVGKCRCACRHALLVCVCMRCAFSHGSGVVQRWETEALGDANMRILQKGEVIQLERKGYYICDAPLLRSSRPVVLLSIPDGRSKTSEPPARAPAAK
jgi:hypothetical protein